MAGLNRAEPRCFCWTRFGTEAGETVEAILARKELERQANDGVFYWGVGSSVGPGIEELVRSVDTPEVFFSPIKSRPRRVDVAPAAGVNWTWAQGLTCGAFRLPADVRVTSRWDPADLSQRTTRSCAHRPSPWSTQTTVISTSEPSATCGPGPHSAARRPPLSSSDLAQTNAGAPSIP